MFTQAAKAEKEHKPEITQVNFLEFLYHYLSRGNFYDAVEQLEKRYHTQDFQVSVAFVTLFYIIQNREDVRRVLSANTRTGYQNHNFDVSHGHNLNINATQAFANSSSMERNPLWRNIHSGLAQSVGDRDNINRLITKHIHKLFAKPTFDLDVAFENFMLDFWCEYMFGTNVNANEFKQTRNKLLSAMRYTFYDSKMKNIPLIGTQACRLYRYFKQDEFNQIDNELQKYIDQADSGLIHRFKQTLQDSADFPRDKIAQAVLDNTFDFIIVFDFIHNAMYETLTNVVRENKDNTADRKAAYKEGLDRAYLFPFRTRVPQQNVELSATTVSKGTPVYINLRKSGLHHSFGPRSCVGTAVTNWIKDAIWHDMEGGELRLLKTTQPEERKQLSHSRDVPISPERYHVKWQYPRDYLQKTLPHHPFKGVDNFYDVLKVYENPALSNYVTSSFVDEIQKLHLDTSNLCIVTPEVRGIPAAAAVAHDLHVPLVMIRKQGKIPGDVVATSYSTAYSKDTLELSATSDLKHKDVVLIDDGIASGGTTKACCDLVKQQGGNVKMILAMINHTYKERTESLKEYKVHTLFDFAKEPEAKAKNSVSLASSQVVLFKKPAESPASLTTAAQPDTRPQIMAAKA